MLRSARGLLALWRRLKFRVWVIELRLRLRARGCKLVLDAPHGGVIQGRPAIRVFPAGDGSGVFNLSLGRNVWIGRGLALDIDPRGENTLEVGDECLIMQNVRLILQSGRIRLGARCNLRDGVWLKSSGELLLGEDIPIAQNSSVHCARQIVFEDRVGLAERVSVLDSDHGFDGSSTYFLNRPLNVDPTFIRRNSFVAAGAVILRGAHIGANSFVAANAVVRGGDYAAGALIAGIPAKIVAQHKQRFSQDQGASLEAAASEGEQLDRVV